MGDRSTYRVMTDWEQNFEELINYLNYNFLIGCNYNVQTFEIMENLRRTAPTQQKKKKIQITSI